MSTVFLRLHLIKPFPLFVHLYFQVSVSKDQLNALLLQPQAREKAQKEGFEVSVAKTSFKANTKALAENEGEGLAKVTFLQPLITPFFNDIR